MEGQERPIPRMDRAATLNRLLFTHDDDMLAEAVRRLRGGQSVRGVVYAHPTRVSIGRCISDLELIAKAEKIEEYQERIRYLPL